MGELSLSGTFLDISINKNGDVLVLSESKLYIIGLPQRKKESLNYVTLPEEDSSNPKPDLGYNSAKRCWWVPSLDASECILVLTEDLEWKQYRRFKDSIKWIQDGIFSSKLKGIQKNHGLSSNSSEFVDLIFTGIVCCQNLYKSKPQEMYEKGCHNIHAIKEYFCIDDEKIPVNYNYGYFDIGKKRNKYIKKIKKTSPVSKNSYNSEVDLDIEKENTSKSTEEGAVIQQIIKTSASGSKRVVTYVLDGKNNTENNIQDDKNEKVLCVCGADEEDSSADEEWVQCDLCRTWQHVECVAYYPEVQDYFHCDNCLRKENESEGLVHTSKARSGKQRGRPAKSKSNQESFRMENDKSTNLDSNTVPKSKIVPPGKQEVFSPVRANFSSEYNHSPATEFKLSDKEDEQNCVELSDNSESSFGILHRGNYINCPCGAEESESGEEWVQCDECDKWQHQACVNFGAENESQYQCPSCKQIITYFSNNIKTLPKVSSGLSGPRPYKIPKVSKSKKDTFDIVGHSCFSSCHINTIIQPLYIPKSVNELIKHLKDCSITERSEKSQLPINNCSQSVLSSNLTHDVRQESSPSSTEYNYGEDMNRDFIKTVGTLETEDCCTERSDFIFCFMLFTKFLVILRSCPDRKFDLASIFEFGDRNICSFAVKNDCPNSEHMLALIDYDSSDILIWKFKNINDTEMLCAKENFSLPGLSCIDKKVVNIKGFENIYQVMWLNKHQILVHDMYSLACYDVDTLNICWKYDHNFDFVADWFLQENNVLIVWDAMNSHVVIDPSNGTIIEEKNNNQKSSDISVASKFSPSQLLKYEITSSSLPPLQYNLPLRLKIILNPFQKISKSQCWVQKCSLGEEMFLSNTYFFEFNKPNQKEICQDDMEKEINLIYDITCPVCNTTNYRSYNGLHKVCTNSHNFFIDPSSKRVIDPFSAKLCTRCDVQNVNEAHICGNCSNINMVPL